MAPKTVTEDYESLRKDLKRLRSDVATLAQSLTATGTGRARAVKDSAVEEARRRLDELSNRARAVQERGMEAIESVERQVAGNPWKSVGVVFGVGMLMGVILNWIFGRRND